jgi:lipopolysaccharide/colanic/teichoic acid biosynthesis glycosyltransferase
MVKRSLDVVVSALALALLAPLFVALAVAIKLDSPGPVFYRGVRVGRFGVPFRMFKFRSMVADAERIGGSSTADSDPRITRVGRVLRRYKLDELPQLIDVLRGTMSLVGPRPQVPEDVALYTPAEREILTLRPGITDDASIRFHNEGEILRGSPDPDRAYVALIREEKLRLCVEYVRRHSVRGDLRILWRTAAALLSSRRAG